MQSPDAANERGLTKRSGPSRWSGPLAFVFLILGVVFALLLYQLLRWAHASQGSADAVTITSADILLLGGGAIACWVIAVFLLRWRRKQRQEPSRGSTLPR